MERCFTTVSTVTFRVRKTLRVHKSYEGKIDGLRGLTAFFEIGGSTNHVSFLP
jgi:hypothetical protein